MPLGSECPEDDGDLLKGFEIRSGGRGLSCQYRRGRGRGAVAALSEEFSLVLLDVSRPDMSGIEVVRRLRGNHRTRPWRRRRRAGCQREGDGRWVPP